MCCILLCVPVRQKKLYRVHVKACCGIYRIIFPIMQNNCEFMISNINSHQLLHGCGTRWFTSRVARWLEQWKPFIHYFQGRVIEEILLAVENIDESLADPSIYCSFLNYLLQHQNRFYLNFQSKVSTLHLIHDTICDLYRFLFLLQWTHCVKAYYG